MRPCVAWLRTSRQIDLCSPNWSTKAAELLRIKIFLQNHFYLLPVGRNDANLRRTNIDSSSGRQVLHILNDQRCFFGVEKGRALLFAHVTPLDALKNDGKSFERKATPVAQRFSLESVGTWFQFVVIEHFIGKLKTKNKEESKNYRFLFERLIEVACSWLEHER